MSNWGYWGKNWKGEMKATKELQNITIQKPSCTDKIHYSRYFSYKIYQIPT
jgi:hypothetical protein